MISALAGAIYEHRKLGEVISSAVDMDFVDFCPYEIQSEVLTLTHDQIVAWKLGGTGSKSSSGVTCGPIFADSSFLSSTSLGLFEGELDPVGFFGLEIELAIKLHSDFAWKVASGAYADIIQSVAIAIEVPWSVFEFQSAASDLILSDFCASGLLIRSNGKSFDDVTAEKFYSEMYRNGSLILAADLSGLKFSLVDAALAFLQLVNAHKLLFNSSMWIATGSLAELVPIHTGCQYVVKSNLFDDISLDFS